VGGWSVLLNAEIIVNKKCARFVLQTKILFTNFEENVDYCRNLSVMHRFRQPYYSDKKTGRERASTVKMNDFLFKPYSRIYVLSHILFFSNFVDYAYIFFRN
jgi:hypothetical protein